MHTIPTPSQIRVNPRSSVLPIRRRLVVSSWFSSWPFALLVFSVFIPFNSQIVNLSLYAKSSPENSQQGSQQLEDLRGIRHFSNSNLRIFEQFYTFHTKIMRIFEQNATFSPTSGHWPLIIDRSSLTFPAKPAPDLTATINLSATAQTFAYTMIQNKSWSLRQFYVTVE